MTFGLAAFGIMSFSITILGIIGYISTLRIMTDYAEYFMFC